MLQCTVYMMSSSKHYNCLNLIMKFRYCWDGTLNKTLVQGKIVLCDALDTGEEPAVAGAAGCIMRDEVYQDVAFLYPLPTSYLSMKDGSHVATYLNSTRYRLP